MNNVTILVGDAMNGKAMQKKVLQWAIEKGYTSVGSLGGPREAPRAGYDITPRGEKFFFVKFGKSSLFEATVRIFHPSVVQVRSWQPGEPCRWDMWQLAPPKEPIKDTKAKGLGPRNRRRPIPWESLKSSLEDLEPHYLKHMKQVGPAKELTIAEAVRHMEAQ